MNTRTRLAAACAMATAAATILLAGPASAAAPQATATPAAHRPASAVPAATTKATPATSYNGACGSGYSVIDQLPVSTLGTVYLTYNSASGKNCVETLRADPGAATRMQAYIQLSGVPGSKVSDTGNYTTYAGPVYLHAPAHCIDWGGYIGTTGVNQNSSHCG